VAEACANVGLERLGSAEAEGAADAEGRSAGVGLVPDPATQARPGCESSLVRTNGGTVPMLFCDLVVLLPLVSSSALDGAGRDADTERRGSSASGEEATLPFREAEGRSEVALSVRVAGGTGDSSAVARRNEARAAEAKVGAAAAGLLPVPPVPAVVAALVVAVTASSSTDTTSSVSEPTDKVTGVLVRVGATDVAVGKLLRLA
jgi:hypothetical protein